MFFSSMVSTSEIPKYVAASYLLANFPFRSQLSVTRFANPERRASKDASGRLFAKLKLDHFVK